MFPRALAIALAAAPILASCARSNDAEPMGKIEIVAPSTPAEHVYTTRGRITGLPATGQLYLRVHHENIPEFVGRDGTRIGMNEMDMEFPWIAPGLSLRSLRIGDAVSLSFEVRWKSEPLTLVTKLEKLPADTPLNLGGFVEDAPPEKAQTGQDSGTSAESP